MSSFPPMSETSTVHHAGPVTEQGQFCRRCGQVLTGGWPDRSKVLTSGRLSIKCADIVPADCVPPIGEEDQD